MKLLIIFLTINFLTYSQIPINYFVDYNKNGIGNTIETALPNLTILQDSITKLLQNSQYTYNITIKIKGYDDYIYLSNYSKLISIPRGLKVKDLIISNYDNNQIKPMLSALGKEIGLEADIDDLSSNIENVYITNIVVQNALRNCIKVKGLLTKKLNKIEIKNCEITNNNPKMNDYNASLLLQNAVTSVVKDCIINQTQMYCKKMMAYF